MCVSTKLGQGFQFAEIYLYPSRMVITLTLISSKASSITSSVIVPCCTDGQRVELRHLLEQYKGTLQDKPGRARATEHIIDTGTAKPVKLPPYRLPYAYRDQVQKELKEMVKDGIATTSNSEWAAPIVLITKKDGGIRFCVDYRRLNAVLQ